jgi:hypothetical protein
MRILPVFGKKAENLVAATIFVKNGGGMCSKLVTTQIGNNLNTFLTSTILKFSYLFVPCYGT